MPFLAKQQIFEQIQEQDLIEKALFNAKHLHQSSYDLSLGPEIYLVGETSPKLLKTDYPYAALSPGQFAILTTLERVNIPDSLLALISIRSKFKFQGLVNISGFHVDPTFKGRLRFAVQNVGPTDIHLKLGTPTFSIFFAKLTSNEIGATRDKESDIHIQQNVEGIRLEDVQLLGGNSLTLTGVQKQIDRLETLVKIYGAAAIPILIAIIVKLLRG